MAISLRLATTTAEIDSVFRLRHLVFSEQESFLSSNTEKRIYDRYDTYPSTVQLIAQHEGETVGAVRLSLDDVCGLPADEYFDFSPHIPDGSIRMHVSMFCVHQAFRREKIAMGLILMASCYAFSNDVTHIVAPINPRIAPLLRRIGFKKVGDVFRHSHLNIPVLPLLLDVQDVQNHFIDIIKQNQLCDFTKDHERWLYQSGEKSAQAGDAGTRAIILDPAVNRAAAS